MATLHARILPHDHQVSLEVAVSRNIRCEMQDGETVGCSVLRVVWSCLELSGAVNTEGPAEMSCGADFVGPDYCQVDRVRGYE